MKKLTRDEFVKALDQFARDNDAVDQATSPDREDCLLERIKENHDALLDTYDEMDRQIAVIQALYNMGIRSAQDLWRCPYCEAVASNVMIHTDVGNELDDHYHCPWCRAEEMPFDAEPTTPAQNLTRWYEPPHDSWYWDQTRFPKKEIPF